jgi:amidase
MSITGTWPGAALDLSMDLRGVRIGWLGDLGGYLPIEDGILTLCEQALTRLADDGCRVEPVAPAFDPEQAWQTWLTWRRWLVAGALRPFADDPAQRAQLKPEALWEVQQGERLSARDVSDASVARSLLYQQLLAMFEHHDVLALPSAQVWPFDADTPWPKVVAGRTMDTYHRWMEVVIYATLAGLPAVSVPVGFGSNGLPMGMQLIGRPQADLAVLRMAQAHAERSFDVLARRPAALDI